MSALIISKIREFFRTMREVSEEAATHSFTFFDYR